MTRRVLNQLFMESVTFSNRSGAAPVPVRYLVVLCFGHLYQNHTSAMIDEKVPESKLLL